jgi:aromatic-amino-acid transaminase
MFEQLQPRPADPLLDIIRQFRQDTRPNKLDLGVGVFQDENGRTPVLSSVKKAERHLLETQDTKTYVGAEGDVEFTRLFASVVLGPVANESRTAGLQAPGGTGALRLGGELIRLANPAAQIWLGLPTWPNHQPIFSAVGLKIRGYRHFDPATQLVCFDEMISAMHNAGRGDVFVLHGSCHNPTGADFTPEQWAEIARLCAERDLIPFIDIAYQGFARGLDEDMEGARLVLKQVPEALVSVSCSKNFGIYRERTGALYVLAPNAEKSSAIRTNLVAIARANYSMPPDHGAAVVRKILETAELKREWVSEVGHMRDKLNDVRQRLAQLRVNSLDLAPLARQNGMFATLPLSKGQIARLKDEHAIYLVPSGRMNIAGLMAADLNSFAAALRSTLVDAAA